MNWSMGKGKKEKAEMGKKKIRKKGEGEKADRIWKGGIGAMAMLLFLFLAAVVWLFWGDSSGRVQDIFPEFIILILLYGAGNMGVLCKVYFAVAKEVNETLEKLGDLAEDLISAGNGPNACEQPFGECCEGCIPRGLATGNVNGGKVREVFPAQEDTALSKLQGQLLKLYDISRSYEVKEQEMRRQLDENIGNLVHQINTPITNIGLYVGFLKREDLTQEEKERFTGYIEAQAKKLGWLGEGFSKISRMETGIIRQRPERQDLLPLILEAVNQVMEKAVQKGMNIELAGEKHSLAIVDSKWTVEAIFNVLDNGVKYGNKGSSIEILVTELIGYVCVAVRNDGIKIEKDEYHKVFKRFYRGKEAGKLEGVGLGLTIAREVLEGEKGYMEVKALWDGRTEFAMYFSKI